jgi:Ni/Fe-hydrogenase subunit HybB-like protein
VTAMNKVAPRFLTISGQSKGYYIFLLVLTIVTLAGAYAAHYMESHGHVVTGMNNQVVWGMPHVFAIFLIVAASGALNIASMGSVFGQQEYKTMGRLSGLVAIALLLGGLTILVLDLGRPDRLIVAMTTYNFKSIFAWNIFLYTGFLGIVAVYLWMMFEPRMNRYSSSVGKFAFAWRFMLTTGTGSIFGFLVARQAYDAAIMAPMFILMSLSLGTAVFLIVLNIVAKCTHRELEDATVNRVKRLLALFVMAVLYFVLVFNLTNLYATEHHGVEYYVLANGGVITVLFWLGQIALGSILPLVLFYAPAFNHRKWAMAGCVLVILGGFAQLYVLIIGGQSYPLDIFPGLDVIASSFQDGEIAHYAPSFPELMLGLGGISLALLVITIGVRILPFLPEKFHLSDKYSAS